MQICIHRGAQEIGGSCIEVEHAGARLILDLGLPLEAEVGREVAVPDVKGLGDADSEIVGLVLSHGHPDHYGLEKAAHPSIPRYIGRATQSILQKASFFTPSGADIAAAGHLEDRRPLQIGPFTVTPHLVDHSAFDAYAILVEAGQRRIMYTGDLRAHGRKVSLFERLVADPPRNIDVLLLEGTNIQPPHNRNNPSERDVEERCVEIFSETEGMVLACYSPQNIDRLVTLYRATKRTGRIFVLDLYAATIARATGRSTIPQAEWEGIRVFVTLHQRIKVKQTGTFDLIDSLGENRIFPHELTEGASDFVTTFRSSMRDEFGRMECLTGAHAIWSM